MKRVTLYAEFLKHFAMVCILFKPKFESVWKLERSRIEEKIQSRTARWKTTESHYREKTLLKQLSAQTKNREIGNGVKLHARTSQLNGLCSDQVFFGVFSLTLPTTKSVDLT